MSDSAVASPSRLAREEKTIELGMWIFLWSESMLFGGLIFAFLACRLGEPQAFAAAAPKLNVTLGTINTAVLLTSSLTMALAIHAAKELRAVRPAVIFLVLTIVLGAAFLGIKGTEYLMEYREHHLPWFGFEWPDAGQAKYAELFFVFYFLMTCLHAIHMIGGITALACLGISMWRKERPSPILPLVGLYWHFVDIVWIFLFPLLYLNGRS